MRGRLASAAVIPTLILSTVSPAAASTTADATAPTAAHAIAPFAGHGGVPAGALRPARQALAPDDGWAAAGAGTTGGSAADDAHITVAHNRAELLTALGGAANAVPKIVFVSGRIDMDAGPDGTPLTCADYADPEYDLDAFLRTYDPAVWGRTEKPSGPLEEARARSAQRQGAQIRIPVGSNTTLIGIDGARIAHGSLTLTGVGNVIVRNIAFTDAADCFPAWDPTDGSAGNWNSLYDLVSLSGATNVWIDHDTFSDGNNHDADQPLYFGRPYQVHDGATDIIRGSDLVTVSYNDYYDHDKTMLIGSTDTAGVDVGKLRVTVHHNRFGNVLQRAPRVRYGQVDVYDNAYTLTDDDYSYSLGAGVGSAIYAENNFFVRSADVPDADIIKDWKGTRITAIGSLVRVGSGPAVPVDLVAAHNAAYDPDLSPDAGWVPVLRPRLDPTAAVPGLVARSAGAGKLGC
ncbi:pectate lyase [Couchioplanes caeruleus]|uniref:pectate lyase family protein n=1 Tax=Couchioplanes caeruleus TaxID=56438 RepID=UPI0020BFAF88|nr:pectate lyase [Couchioplanes caeruleus]UQU62131.1 pectate lyase [Couchioplanes caeruleus]